MNELRRVVQKKLITYHPRTYFQVAPNDAKWPYVVYDFPASFTIEDQDIFNLDIDVWDSPPDGDTTAVETLAGVIWRGLDGFRHIDKDIQFSVYRENRLNPEDDDSRIRRRKLIFQLRYFRR